MTSMDSAVLNRGNGRTSPAFFNEKSEVEILSFITAFVLLVGFGRFLVRWMVLNAVLQEKTNK